MKIPKFFVVFSLLPLAPHNGKIFLRVSPAVPDHYLLFIDKIRPVS